MPRRSTDWGVLSFWTPCRCRMESEKWDHIATAADLDGDTGHAANARVEAANFRQLAREMEADAITQKEQS